MATYKELFMEMEKTRTEVFDVAGIASNVMGAYESVVVNELSGYYENNTENIEQILYEDCKAELRCIINKYKSLVSDISILVIALYEITKSQTSKAKFFWDVFAWRDMKFLFGDKGGSAEC